MASVQIVNEKTVRISVDISDAIAMIREASQDIGTYAHDVVTICEKMPAFQYTSFCFYAYDSALLFEKMLGTDPRQFNSFSLDAPDGFFYTLFGGMTALYGAAKALVSTQMKRSS